MAPPLSPPWSAAPPNSASRPRGAVPQLPKQAVSLEVALAAEQAKMTALLDAIDTAAQLVKDLPLHDTAGAAEGEGMEERAALSADFAARVKEQRERLANLRAIQELD